MRKPDFFIIGGQKCGTSSLAGWLSLHPQIFHSERKELLFFNTDFGPRLIDNLDDYERHFNAAGDHHLAVGESSTLYLLSYDAPNRILEYSPDAKFIVLLRDPIGLFVSLHQHLLFNLIEDIEDPQEAWEAQDDRERGLRYTCSRENADQLRYGFAASLGLHLQRWLEIVPPDRVFISFLDNIGENPRAVYLQVLDFLGVPDDGRNKFPKLNIRKRNVYPTLKRGMAQLTHLRNRLGIRYGLGILNYLSRWNITKGRQVTLNTDFERQLLNYFHTDVNRLSQITGRDLETLWHQRSRVRKEFQSGISQNSNV